MYGGGEAFIDETEALTPAGAALMMQLGIDGVFVAPGSSSPAILARVSKSLGEPMVGIGIHDLLQTERLARRGG